MKYFDERELLVLLEQRGLFQRLGRYNLPSVRVEKFLLKKGYVRYHHGMELGLLTAMKEEYPSVEELVKAIEAS